MNFTTELTKGNIVVGFGDRKFYHVVNLRRAISYPIAIPRKEARWQGALNVAQKKVKPSWTPTASMRRDNPKLPAFVPGRRPRNPMGAHALSLGSRLTSSTAQTPHGQSARTYLVAASACESRQLKHEDIYISCRLKGRQCFKSDSLR